MVTNDGAGPLRIHGLSVPHDGGGVFRLDSATLPAPLGPGDDLVLEVRASPSEAAEGLLRVLSNDPHTPVLDVPLEIGARVQECPDGETYPAEAIATDDTCAFSGLPPAWDPIVETQWRAYPDHFDHGLSYVPPIVGRLTDDDGDGDIDTDDPPDIVTVSILEWGGPVYSGVLRVLSADGRRQHWSLAEWVDGSGTRWVPTRIGTPAIGDIDGDGWPDVVVPVDRDTYDGGPGVLALAGDGSPLWVLALDHGGAGLRPAVSIADLEGDGAVEVVVGPTILSGLDGTILGKGDVGFGMPRGRFRSMEDGPKSVPMDLDGDGTMEVIAGRELLAPDGSTICLADTPDGTVATADVDGDGLGEVVLVQDGAITIYEHDCTVTRTWALPDAGHGGPATLADFDGDGHLELGVASRYAYYVFESDGSVLWEEPIRDESSHSTGSSVFDFDGDGSSEVVFADEHDLYVLDGATGRARFVWTGHASGTASEYPTIADVDDDGSAEIIVAHAARTDLAVEGISIIGSESSGWMPARSVWNQHGYSVFSIDDDLAVPADPSPNWPELNSFRSADTLGTTQAFDRNARPALVDVCNLDCDTGVQRVVVRVDNPGTEDLPVGVRFHFVATIGGAEVVVASGQVEEPIPAGTASRGLAFDIDLALMPERDLSVVVDPDDRVRECDETDNRLDLTVGLCPPD